MKAQDIFDTVVAHLRQQNAKALATSDSLGPHCVYRAADGKKCAAGCLIPNDLYDPKMEGKAFVCLATMATPELNMDFPKLRAHFADTDHNLIGDLQEVHDKYEVGDWEALFKRLAGKKGLTYTVP